jgi:ATP-binding cassette subfamily F protein uup
MLHAHNLTLSFGARPIFDDITLTLMPHDRIALVGDNGMGKSTLLNVLAGLEPLDQGAVECSASRIGFLRQIPDLDPELSVIETMRLGLKEQLEAIKEHELLCEELAVADKSAHANLEKKIALLADKIEHLGGFDHEFRMERVLSRLGIKARDQLIKTLSGGERRRVDLARVLLSSPDIYVLDEPTNHLDIGAIAYLVETFKKISAPLFFVSHDSAFIDDLATRIVELDKGKLYTHEPPFANYLENKLVRELIDERSLHRRERLVVGELAWLRAGTPARTTKQNARIDRAHELIDQCAKDSRDQRVRKVQMSMADSKRLGRTILELEDVGVAFGDRVLFKHVNLKVGAGQRFGILGPNGAGKSTLLALISQKIIPTYGRMRLGKNTEIIQFDQHREQLDKKATLKETLADHGDYVFVGEERMHIASYLERYLFSPGCANREVSTLSGGEQNRLLLAKLFRKTANCLLLDEPTNDLDVSSLAVLEEQLLDYPGVVFTVSHDRRFLDKVCNTIIAFEPCEDGSAESNLAIYQGNYSTYLALKAQSEAQKETLVKTKENIGVNKSERVRTKSKRSFKEQREFEAMEGQLEAMESERADLHEMLAQGDLFRQAPELVQEKMERLRILELKIEESYARWQELLDLGE